MRIGRYAINGFHGLLLAAALGAAAYIAFRNDPQDLENISRASEVPYPSPTGAPAPATKQKLRGRVVHEKLFAPTAEFGLVYRIEVSNENPDVQRRIKKYADWMRSVNPYLEERQFGLPFVVVGEARELTDIDNRINVDDAVEVDDRNIHMWSIDGDPVIVPDKLNKL